MQSQRESEKYALRMKPILAAAHKTIEGRETVVALDAARMAQELTADSLGR
jgi:hypothetical protein